MKRVINAPEGVERVKFILSRYIEAKEYLEPQNKEKIAPVLSCPAWVWGDWCKQIETWIALLPSAYKDILERHYIQGEPVEAIAKEEKVLVSHVKNEIYLACKMLDEKGFMKSLDVFFDDDEIGRG